MDWQKKNVLVIGMARSGIAAAKLCSSLGANVTIQDMKSEANLEKKMREDIQQLKQQGISLRLGINPDDMIETQDLIIVSPGVPTDLGFLQYAKEKNIPIWAEIELGYSQCPSPIIAITGTNGKTTTTMLVGEIMKNYVSNTYIVGNIGTPFTGKVSQMKENDCVVAEISSFQLETIHTFKPRISAVLNITPDHLNRHKTLENYIKAKERIFMNQDEEDFCILNFDDEVCRQMQNKMNAQVIFFSRKNQLDQGVFLHKNQIYIRWKEIEGAICDIEELQIFGGHNIENALAATAICMSMGVPIENIRQTMIAFRGVEHRIEYVDTIKDVEYYNDSKATNPDAAIVAIAAMKSPIILVAGGMDKKNDFTDWIQSFSNKVKRMIVLGETADNIIETAAKHGFTAVEKVNGIEEAVLAADKSASPGDCVLLSPACASWDMFSSYEERGRIFKEAIYKLRG